MSEQVYGRSLEIGDEIGPLVKSPNLPQVQAFLGVWRAGGAQQASRFTDPELAAKEGLPGPIVPGSMSQAFLAQLLTDWMGPGGRLRSLDVVFRRSVLHEKGLKCLSLVTDKREEDSHTVVRLDVMIEDPRGDRPVQGTAELVLPTHP